MREILFRAKRQDNGEWIEGFLSYGNIIKTVRKCYDWRGDYVCDSLEEYKVDKETVGQFTGLTDKKGKKIFEGDIVKCRHICRLLERKEVLANKKPRRSYGLEAVKREDPIYRLYRDEDLYDLTYFRNYVVKADIVGQRTRLQNGSDTHYLSASYVSNHGIEIIGNIHDNPELLEVQNG